MRKGVRFCRFTTAFPAYSCAQREITFRHTISPLVELLQCCNRAAGAASRSPASHILIGCPSLDPTRLLLCHRGSDYTPIVTFSHIEAKTTRPNDSQREDDMHAAVYACICVRVPDNWFRIITNPVHESTPSVPCTLYKSSVPYTFYANWHRITANLCNNRLEPLRSVTAPLLRLL